jgi:putative ABC transport system ATP-binding protein
VIAEVMHGPYRLHMSLIQMQHDDDDGLSLRDVSSVVLKGVNLSVGKGQGRAIVGPSGSGKTSLFRAISDLDPNTGRVALGLHDREAMAAPEWRRRVAYVPAEPAWWLQLAGDHADAEARSLAGSFGLDETLLLKPVSTLSTGERQRLALAIAFARKPDVLLLDEPTSALDDDNRHDVEAAILSHVAGGGILLIASHDKGQLERLALEEIHIEYGALVNEGRA